MYSQRNEERYILEACEQSAMRKLLDIGAWDPRVFSNSRALIESGWSAVLVEPSPGPLRTLVAEYAKRADVDVLAGAVAIESSLLMLQVTDDAVSAEAGSEHVKTWAASGTKYIGRLWVQAFTVEQLLSTFGPFDFVNIDTEGTSVDILKALVATEMFPHCICVEHNGRIVEATQAATERHYHVSYMSEENIVFSL